MKEIFLSDASYNLVKSNYDAGCALGICIHCEEKLGANRYWFKNVDILAICEAPWCSGLIEKRPLAIVYECNHCFEYSWFHTTERHKEALEELYKESDGFTK